MKRAIALMLLLAAGAWMPPAHAQSCSLTSGTGTLVDFSAYTSISGTVDATGTLTLNCVPGILGLPVAYSISIGTGGASSFNPRKLSSGGFNLNYNLYVDLTRLLIWGDGTVGTQKQSGTCLGSCAVSVYGRLPGGQSVPSGAYSDQVAVTLDF